MTDNMPAFRVDGPVFERFPDYIVALVEVHTPNEPASSDMLEKLRNDAVSRHLASFGDSDLKDLHPIAVWRHAFSSAGWSASRYPSSVEALGKRVAKSKQLPTILPLVDLASVGALTYLVPVGTHDVDSFVDGLLEVRYAAERDVFSSPGRDKGVETPPLNEIVYASGHDVRTRRWVWRQSRSALISRSSNHVTFPVDGFARSTQRRVEAAAEFIDGAAKSLFDASTHLHWIDSDHPSTQLQLGE